MKVRSLAALSSLTTLALLLSACSNETADAPKTAPADQTSLGTQPQPVSASVRMLADDVRLNDPKPELAPARSAAEHLGHSMDKHLSTTLADDKANLFERVQASDKGLPPIAGTDLRQQLTAHAGASPEYQLKQQSYLARLHEIPSGLPAAETDARRAALKQSVLGE